MLLPDVKELAPVCVDHHGLDLERVILSFRDGLGLKPYAKLAW